MRKISRKSSSPNLDCKPTHLNSSTPPDRVQVQGVISWQSEPALGYDSVQPSLCPTSIFKRSRSPEFRLLCDRSSAAIRIYAGKMDLKGSITLDESCMKWLISPGVVDGFASSMVLIWKPSTQLWAEVSLMGHVYDIRESRSELPDVSLVYFDNILEDGSLIYSGGCTFLWKGGSKLKDFDKLLTEYLGSLTCPITLDFIPVASIFESIEKCRCKTNPSKLLLFKKHSKRNLVVSRYKERPWYFSGCGHVFSFQDQFAGFGICPCCRREGFFRPIFVVASAELLAPTPDSVVFLPNKDLNACFVPCGHLISRKEALFWTEKIRMPFEGKDGFAWYSACPFCSADIDSVQNLFIQ